MNLETYKSQFELFLAGLDNEPQSSVDERKNAFDKFLKLGLPTKKNEYWQYTNLTPITKSKFNFIRKNGSSVNDKQLDNLKIPQSKRIVFENGRLNSGLSDLDNNISVKNSRESFANGELSFNKDENNSFVSLNGAFTNGGFLIDVENNFSEKDPLHIINIIANNSDNIQNHQSNFIKIGKNSAVTIVEEFINISNSKLFNNIVNNIELNENSNLNYITFQNNKSDAINLNHVFINQADDSNYNAQFITKNGSLIRNDINVQIKGENCETNVSGLGLLDQSDHIENYTIVNHNKPHCNSRQLFKYILKDFSEGVFNGLVKVRPDAQNTDSQQTNRNILLSKKALMISNPQLEIYADDVKCAHGSATGELDDEAIFYLRSRGIDQITAKSLLIEGFAKEIVEKIKIDSVKERINKVLLKWLSN